MQWLNHTDFKKFEDISDKYFKGNLVGKISQIRIASFKQSSLDNISVKYSMKDEAQPELIPVVSKQKFANPNPKLYRSFIPISKPKYNDLKNLCETSVFFKIFHREYLSLPYGNVKDVLIDTAIEDDNET